MSVGLSLSPILPGITDQEDSLDALIGRAADVGVKRMGGSLLFLRSPTREKYFEFLAAEFPHYLEAHNRAYAGSSHLAGPYRKRIEDTVRRLRERHGLDREDAAVASGAYTRLPEQLDLFSSGPDPRRRASFGYRLLCSSYGPTR